MNPIIVDIGSCVIKAGTNDDDRPTMKSPCYIGKEYDNLSLRKTLVHNKKFICSDCEKIIDSLKLYCPLR